jgi:adenylate cyclase
VREHVEGKLDARFADAGEQRVKNIARPVHVYRWMPMAEAAAALAAELSRGAAIEKRPSIAMLPFENLSGDPEQAHLVDGIAEDVITLLSRVRWLSVIARNSTFTYKGRAVDVQQVAEELGVRYVLQGSVRTAGKRIRVTAQLIDTDSRAHLWAERYDRELEDIFALQDEITEAIVGALEPELGAAERDRARRKPPSSLDAWGCYQRGLWHVYRFRKEDTLEALRLFEQAIALDPEFGSAHAGKSFCHSVRFFLMLSERPAEELAATHDAARRSVEIDDKDPIAHWVLGRAHLFAREHERAIAELETAIELNPSFAHAHYNLGWVLGAAGRPEEALPCLDKAYQLSPRDPLLFAFLGTRAMSLLQMGQYDQAAKWGELSVRPSNAHFHNHAILTSSLGHLGRTAEAKRALDETLRLRPDYSGGVVERMMPFKHRREQGEEAYLLQRTMGRVHKFSFHKSGICNWAQIEERRDGSDRAMLKWRRDPLPEAGSGLACVLMTLVFPTNHLSARAAEDPDRLYWIKPASGGRAVAVEISLTREDETTVKSLFGESGKRELVFCEALRQGANLFAAVTHFDCGPVSLRVPAKPVLPGQIFGDLELPDIDCESTGRPIRMLVALSAHLPPIVWELGGASPKL